MAIAFLVKNRKLKSCKIHYARRPEFETAEDKLAFLSTNPTSTLTFESVTPDKDANWLNITNNDWDSLVPVISKKTKAARTKAQEKAIFGDFSMGFITARDDWLVGLSSESVERKVKYFLSEFNSNVRESLKRRKEGQDFERSNTIKWSRSMIAALEAGTERTFDSRAFRQILLRPFVERTAYFGSGLVEMPNKMPAFFPANESNTAIFFNDPGARTPFSPLASTLPGEYHLAASYDGFQGVPQYRFLPGDGKIDNVTDWGLRQFKNKYEIGASTGRKSAKTKLRVTKSAIFFYVYAALHDPLYQKKYSQNLKRDFPRVPLHDDFWKWAAWGEQLLRLHTDYKKVEPWMLRRTETLDKTAREAGVVPKALLRADVEQNRIIVDTETTIDGIPSSAWAYRLGSRSALEWILDQHKEKPIRDATVREKFNSYRFADHKEQVIDLIARVTRVSVETVAILEQLSTASCIGE
ncbi:type ISP restriction/modification enzyme [Bradyrhizobium sp. CCBAU 11434]|uniref:type ISP restriction/modification enzyme n=1 Tax=Bradyrhizobium sp. CCBAU 11434 TaxID=1630885 RepID=UPI002305AF43|nr:type ISP restriction/modification enzyme [Bradyrhizobium sp. CCBAU 11434]